ncbi:MAG: hypothetical protein Terrestrivirus5_12 [Terrestrivirus sp.]|uniref:V-SNARE coiled-coil homology domain-containing protein n=1 Tax=Terrestrivirus sp. TaxID=2487775 RepID=A0A3G4ZMV6_9VIRU|nr:MAG: hypothetical protein Terrestrivirus5_12 [Terrestrivirus sp.]
MDRNVEKIRFQVEEVQNNSFYRKNLTDIEKKGDKLEELDRRTDELEAQAMAFKKGARKVREHVEGPRCIIL